MFGCCPNNLTANNITCMFMDCVTGETCKLHTERQTETRGYKRNVLSVICTN